MRNRLCVLTILFCMGCSDNPTGPDPMTSEIDEMAIFVRDWPDEYVEILLTREEGKSTLVIFRPPQPGVPRVLLDSIGPDDEDPPEIVELLNTFDIWEMADSNAVGAACNTKSGQWICNPTNNDYSLVIGVSRGGTRRAQRYTRLGESGSSQIARALGDYVFEMARKSTTPAGDN